jgi:hypothetical protein
VRSAFTKNEWELLSLNAEFLESVGKVDSMKSAEETITSNVRVLLLLGRLEPNRNLPRPPPRPSP